MDEEIRERTNGARRGEDYARLHHALLELFAEKSSRKEYLDQVVELLQGWSGCCCAGVRVLDEYGNIPYESYSGFSREFWESESHLSLHRDQCACIRVISERADPQDFQVMTPCGSFYSNHTFRFVDQLSDGERERFRGTCIHAGFASVAIIPVRYRDEVLGAIHLADQREGMVPRAAVEFIESLTPLIGEAIHRFNLEEQVQRDRETQKVISSLLSFSLEDIPLGELLRRDFEFIVSLPWLSLEPKGAIYLLEDEPRVLVRKGQFGLSELAPGAFARIPFGQSLCGQAAQERKILFVDEHHRDPEGFCQAMPPHGHYCVPLVSGEAALGVVDLFLPVGFRDEERKRELLGTIAKVLVSTIQRKRAEETLRESENELRRLSFQLLGAQERERKRIAQELHDGLGQILAAIKFAAENTRQKIEGKADPQTIKALKTVTKLIQNGVEEIRRISTDLRPPILDDLGILATLGWFLREFEAVYSGIRVERWIDIQEKEVPDPLKIVLYRVLQEALNNVAKHSQTDRVFVSLLKTGNTIELAVEDKGIGFEPENCRDGLGLVSMRERVELSGGTFTLKSAKGKGTVIWATWPIK